MKPQTARARRLLPGVAVNYSHLHACPSLSNHRPSHLPPQPPSWPATLRSPGAARPVVQKHSSGHTNCLHSGASRGGPLSQNNVQTLLSPELAFQQILTFYWSITQAEKSPDHRDNIASSERKWHAPSASPFQIKKHNLAVAPKTPSAPAAGHCPRPPGAAIARVSTLF